MHEQRIRELEDQVEDLKRCKIETHTKIKKLEEQKEKC